MIRPGHTVVLKPNFVRDFRETQAGHGDCLITHGSIIRAVLDYVYLALQGEGRIIVADAPQNDADFEAIRQIAGFDEVQGFYREHAGFAVEVYDLRPERARKRMASSSAMSSCPGTGRLRGSEIWVGPCLPRSRIFVTFSTARSTTRARFAVTIPVGCTPVPDLPYDSRGRLRHQPAETEDPQEDRHYSVSEEPRGDQRQQELAAAPSAGDALAGRRPVRGRRADPSCGAGGHGLLQAGVSLAGTCVGPSRPGR